MQYEPQCLEIKYFALRGSETIANYLPDFLIQNGSEQFYVEIKPDPIQGEDSWRSVAMACSAGYQIPMLIVSGWPLRYGCVCIDERYKGNPRGYRARFDKQQVRRLENFVLDCSYPDEGTIQIDEHDRHQFEETNEIEPHLHRIASSAWNETKFKWIAKNSREQNK